MSVDKMTVNEFLIKNVCWWKAIPQNESFNNVRYNETLSNGSWWHASYDEEVIVVFGTMKPYKMVVEMAVTI